MQGPARERFMANVTVTGTASLHKDEKAFVGTSAELQPVLGMGEKYPAVVNLPNGPPEPGKAGKQVVYMWALKDKDAYVGTGTILYMDKNLKLQTVKTDIAQFNTK